MASTPPAGPTDHTVSPTPTNFLGPVTVPGETGAKESAALAALQIESKAGGEADLLSLDLRKIKDASPWFGSSTAAKIGLGILSILTLIPGLLVRWRAYKLRQANKALGPGFATDNSQEQIKKLDAAIKILASSFLTRQFTADPLMERAKLQIRQGDPAGAKDALDRATRIKGISINTLALKERIKEDCARKYNEGVCTPAEIATLLTFEHNFVSIEDILSLIVWPANNREDLKKNASFINKALVKRQDPAQDLPLEVEAELAQHCKNLYESGGREYYEYLSISHGMISGVRQSAPDATEREFAKGLAAYFHMIDQAGYERALLIMTNAADEGSVKAQLWLGDHYRDKANKQSKDNFEPTGAPIILADRYYEMALKSGDESGEVRAAIKFGRYIEEYVRAVAEGPNPVVPDPGHLEKAYNIYRQVYERGNENPDYKSRHLKEWYLAGKGMERTRPK